MPRRRTRHPRIERPGIVQIAAAAGVSPSTVSRALRPETAHLVRAERRRQILELADRQRFSPNPGARMLRRGVNPRLTVVVPREENIFFSEFYGRFLAGALHAAAGRQWDVQIRTLVWPHREDFRETIQHLGVDSSGVIYLAEPLTMAELAQLGGYRRPLVLTKAALPLEARIDDLDVPVVGVDNVGGARSAVRLLLQLGHRRIGLLLGPRDSRDASERRRGYLEALKEAGIAPSAGWIREGAFSAESGRIGMEALLVRQEMPSAVCCASDEIAFGAITALQAAGRRCPDEFSCVGFDDGLWAAMCRPALTTVRQPLADMAERAVAGIIEAAGSIRKMRPPFRADLPAAVVIRESTASIARG